MSPVEKRDWREILLNRKMLVCIFLGVSSGLPLYVLVQLVPGWLRREDVDLATIGLFALVGFPYTWKFVWSPFMDRFKLPFLGRRRGWMLLMQILLLVTISSLGMFNPAFSLKLIVGIVFLVALFSASQDIVIDAYRRELLADDELGVGNSLFVNAYRMSSLVPASLAFILSDFLPWSSVFAITGAFMVVGVLTTAFIPETSRDELAPTTLKDAVIEPFREFFLRHNFRAALAILAFMVLYKLGDNMATALQTPFLIDLGFSGTEIGTAAKFSALGGSILGSFLAGMIMLKVSINRALWLFGIVQMVSILGYYLLSQVGRDVLLLIAVHGFEYVGVGMGAVALIAFQSKQTSMAFTATQFALFSSLMAVPRIFANASTGFLVEWLGWSPFFLFCALMAIPGMIMLFWVAPWAED
jgi:PAT family beta-lactamase induction signal transducer AmpG